MIALSLALILGIHQNGPTDRTGPQPINPVRWITYSDYPPAALRLNEQGHVFFMLDVSAKGKVTRCTITTSSGSLILDRQTCALMHARARFKPAKDASGVAVPSNWSSYSTWRIPD